VIDLCAARGVNPGLSLAPYYPECPGGLLVAITEQRSRADIDRLVEVLAAAIAEVRDLIEVSR
jgi:glycine dehydrogenase subunit 1